MDAEQAKKLTQTYQEDVIDTMTSTFTMDLDYAVRRACSAGNTGAVVSVETPAKHRAEKHLLEKGYTITDKGTGSYTGNTWFKITW